MTRPPPFVPCTWNNVQYRSIMAAAQALGIPYPTMRYRVVQGYTKDSDVHTRRKRVACSWNGIAYPTIEAAAKANVISTMGMRYRFQQGYTCDGDMKR